MFYSEANKNAHCTLFLIKVCWTQYYTICSELFYRISNGFIVDARKQQKRSEKSEISLSMTLFLLFCYGLSFCRRDHKKISSHFLIIIITVTDILQDVIVIIFWTWIRYTFDTINKNTCKIFHKLCFQENCGDTEEFFPFSPSFSPFRKIEFFALELYFSFLLSALWHLILHPQQSTELSPAPRKSINLPRDFIWRWKDSRFMEV